MFLPAAMIISSCKVLEFIWTMALTLHSDQTTDAQVRPFVIKFKGIQLVLYFEWLLFFKTLVRAFLFLTVNLFQPHFDFKSIRLISNVNIR